MIQFRPQALKGRDSFPPAGRAAPPDDHAKNSSTQVPVFVSIFRY
jgi:hypothetical protein